MMRDFDLRLIAVALALAVMLAALAGLPGCHDAGAAPRASEAPVQGTPAPAPKTVAQADDRLAKNQARIDADERDLVDAHAENRGLKRDLDHLQTEAGRVRLAWAAGVLLMTGIGFGILVFVLPATCRGWATMAAVGCTFGASLAMVLRLVYAWLPIAGAVAGCGFVLFAAWQLWQHRKAAREAAAHGDRLEAGIRAYLPAEAADDLLAVVKERSAYNQAQAGISQLLAAIRGKIPHPPAPPAPASPIPPAAPAPPPNP